MNSKLKYLKTFEAFVDADGNIKDFAIDPEEAEYLSKTLPAKNINTLKINVRVPDVRITIDKIAKLSSKTGNTKTLYISAFDGHFFRDGYTFHLNDNYIYDAVMTVLYQNGRFHKTKLISTMPENKLERKIAWFLNHYVYDQNITISDKNIDFDEELGDDRVQFNNRIMPRIFEIACEKGYTEGLEYLKKVSETEKVYYSKLYNL
jgi:hypothetical protein